MGHSNKYGVSREGERSEEGFILGVGGGEGVGVSVTVRISREFSLKRGG